MLNLDYEKVSVRLLRMIETHRSNKTHKAMQSYIA